MQKISLRSDAARCNGRYGRCATYAPGVTLVPWYMYAGFIAFVIAMLMVDLLLFHRDEEGGEPSVKESAAWVAVWVGLAVVVRNRRVGLEGIDDSRASISPAI